MADVKIPRWRWADGPQGTVTMERWGNGDWVCFNDHRKTIAALEAGRAEQFHAAAALADAVVRMEAEKAALKAKIERLTAPVSDEEAVAILGDPVAGRGDFTFKIASCGFADALIAARASAEPDSAKEQP